MLPMAITELFPPVKFLHKRHDDTKQKRVKAGYKICRSTQIFYTMNTITVTDFFIQII